MPDYRRNRVPGGTFFFTVNLLDRRSDLLVTQIDGLREAIRQVRARAPFHIDAWVVLPDHMHCLRTLPEGDADIPRRWRAIKKSLPTGEPRSPFITSRGERGIWQRLYWEHTIRDYRGFAARLDYTHFTPVKHGLVEHPADWPHSSFRRCVASGLYPAAWTGGSGEPQDEPQETARGGETKAGGKRSAPAGERCPSAHYPSGLQPARLCGHWTSTRDGSRRNALRFSALRLLTAPQRGDAIKSRDGSRKLARRSPAVERAPERDYMGDGGLRAQGSA
jgi:putative transposase